MLFNLNVTGVKMLEFKGPAFERVFSYGVAKAKEIGSRDESAIVKAHVRAWATSVLTRPGREEKARPLVEIEWIKEGERIVGVAVDV